MKQRVYGTMCSNYFWYCCNRPCYRYGEEKNIYLLLPSLANTIHAKCWCMGIGLLLIVSNIKIKSIKRKINFKKWSAKQIFLRIKLLRVVNTMITLGFFGRQTQPHKCRWGQPAKGADKYRIKIIKVSKRWDNRWNCSHLGSIVSLK